MTESRRLLQHGLAALAYRTQKALRGAPDGFGEFRAGTHVRTPHELVWHMTGVVGYARTMLRGGTYAPPRLATLEAEVARFHAVLAALRDDLAQDELEARITDEQLLQGPLADAMTHAGQLALLRRLAGAPVPSEDFIFADVRAENVGPAQPEPRAPDAWWRPDQPPQPPGPPPGPAAGATMEPSLEPRRATPADVPALQALIAESARALSVGFYTPAQIDAAVAHVFGVDTQLVADGTYWTIDAPDGPAACGGWSRRRTLYGGDQMKDADDPLLDPATEDARIRAFFVHPRWARRGLARRLYARCAAEARAAGFRGLALMATLPGEPLYRALGFVPIERVTTRLPGADVEFVRMRRDLDDA